MNVEVYSRIVGPHTVNLAIFGFALLAYLRRRGGGFLCLAFGTGLQAVVSLAALIGISTGFEPLSRLYVAVPSIWIVTTYGPAAALLLGFILLSRGNA